MRLFIPLISFLILFFCPSFLFSQIKINEVLSSNTKGITDEDSDYSDWIELYNPTDSSINIGGYVLADKFSVPNGWVFPSVEIGSNSYLLVFASGKDRKDLSSNYRTVINKGDTFKYLVSTSDAASTWRNADYDDSSWSSGKSGFGFADADDNTNLSALSSIFIRKEFEIEDVDAVTELLLHVDYDDGFIAFINGKLVAASPNITYDDNFSSVEITSDHEAQLYQGGKPDSFRVDLSPALLKQGKNVLAIQGYNISLTSSDFSLIPFLTIGSTAYTSSQVASFISVGEKFLHTNFKISNEGESIYLFNTNDELIDSLAAISLESDISYGRYVDGSADWFYFSAPTPGDSNQNPVAELKIDSVWFSVDGGFFDAPFYLEITASSSEGVIRYTLDGSLPTAESSIYTDPLFIPSNRVVKAAFFTDSVSKNPVTTKTYLFKSSNGLPVFSISSDPDNFFDWYEGILVEGPNAEVDNPHFGANYWQDWERPVTVEFFDKTGKPQFNQGAGVKVSGNWSRANDQKSMALYARKEYGKGSFKYKFFHDRENSTFESVILRNSGNDWMYSMFRDGLVSEIASKLDIDRLAFQPSVVYLNGDYWGILNLREKPSENYFSENYGINEEILAILENNGSSVFGGATSYLNSYNTLKNFISSKDIKNDDNYSHVTKLMDISCFIDYQMLEIFIFNGDWPGNNIKFWNTTDGFNKFRWIIYDTDQGFNLYGNASTVNSMAFATATDGPSWPNPPWSTLLLRRLLLNNSFRNQFVNRFSDCMNTNLSAANVNVKIDSIADIISLEMENHLSRWNTMDYNQWLNEVGRMKTFATGRCTIMRNFIRTYFGFNAMSQLMLGVSDTIAGSVKVNTIFPQSYPFKGYYFGEVPIVLKAVSKPGCRFVRWEGGLTSSEPEISVNLTKNMKVTAVFEVATESESAIVINEINYKSSEVHDAGDWVEIYNAGSQSADLSGWILQDANADNKFAFPQGTIIYSGEYLVVCGNLSKFNAVYPSVKNVVGEFAFGLGSDADIVSLFDMKGAKIDQVVYSSTSPWTTEPNGSGTTLELVNPKLDNFSNLSWNSGKMGGTPGCQNSTMVSANELTLPVQEASCFPTVFTDFTTLKFRSTVKGSYSVLIINMQGCEIYSVSGNSSANETLYIDLFIDDERYPGGVYIVKLQTESGVKAMKVVKE